MKFYSLNQKDKIKETGRSFRQAVIEGLAPDRGLYFPERIDPLPDTFFRDISRFSNVEIATRAMQQFTGDSIPEPVLRNIIEETLSFDFPLIAVEKDVFSLELFHGPTLAFKDVGARFMARCLGYFNQTDPGKKVKVLVATSGDTGGAVASGFFRVPGTEVVILYPKGKVSEIQERQLTTFGHNITAIAVDGVFDDCQDMVKTAFLDPDLTDLGLTSANSINIARWLPQMFYFLFAYKKLSLYQKPLSFAVPSGNFGNIAAGIMAWRLGMPVSHFIAATNVNDTVPRYMKTGTYEPKPSVATISNAMDVGNPSNFIRIQALFDQQDQLMKEKFTSKSYTDAQTRSAMKVLKQKHGYLADPHGAVGYLGLREHLNEHPDTLGVFLETAHPVKFLEEVEHTLGTAIDLPEPIRQIMNKPKQQLSIANYEELKSFLLS